MVYIQTIISGFLRSFLRQFINVGATGHKPFVIAHPF